MKHLTIFLLALCVMLPAFAEEECVPAVDAANAMNVNQPECDYSDEGLNGFLHGRLKKNETTTAVAATESVAATAAQSQKGAATNSQFSATHELSVEIAKWSRLPDARAQLLPKALDVCPDGFAIRGERYRPRAKGKILLVIDFSCLR